jgi:hypothetical protein
MSVTVTDWDRARPGDPIDYRDCTPPPCLAPHRDSICTRPKEHTGQHVACTPTHVVAVWPQTADPTVADERLAEARQTTGDELLRAVTADPRLWDRLPRRVVAALAAQAEATERVAS